MRVEKVGSDKARREKPSQKQQDRAGWPGLSIIGLSGRLVSEVPIRLSPFQGVSFAVTVTTITAEITATLPVPGSPIRVAAPATRILPFRRGWPHPWLPRAILHILAPSGKLVILRRPWMRPAASKWQIGRAHV